MSTHRSSRILLGFVGAATVAALVVPGAAFARGPGPGGGGGGGGGGEETTTNSLSVPAIFVGGMPYVLTCDATSVAPNGTPQTGFTGENINPLDYYYVQGVSKWQASCLTAESATGVAAAWGDNLTGDAKLKVGSPIRVEIGLNVGTVEGMTGWTVVKLEPVLDRLSKYGTLATGDPDAGFVSNPVTPYPETRVWTAGTWLKIYPIEAPGSPIVNEAATAEINATGRVVYGYNLRVADLGKYVIEYTFPDVTVTSVNKPASTYEVTEAGSIVRLPITVISGGGGGGGRR